MTHGKAPPDDGERRKPKSLAPATAFVTFVRRCRTWTSCVFFLLHAGFAEASTVVNQAPEQHPGLDNDDDNGNAPPTSDPDPLLALDSLVETSTSIESQLAPLRLLFGLVFQTRFYVTLLSAIFHYASISPWNDILGTTVR
jgi:hypothetical protein